MNVAKNETLFKSDKVCRLCLTRKRIMLPIFYEDETSFPMASRILTYIGIEVSFRLLCCSLRQFCLRNVTYLRLPFSSCGITPQTTSYNIYKFR